MEGDIIMANKVSIFIENTEGKHFELTNSKMTLSLACKLDVNWSSVFKKEVAPYDIILCDYANSVKNVFGMGYSVVHRSNDREESEKIISLCRKKLKDQYDRMMEIRVAKKYHLNPLALSRIELEYHSSDNYEIKIKDIIEKE